MPRSASTYGPVCHPAASFVSCQELPCLQTALPAIPVSHPLPVTIHPHRLTSPTLTASSSLSVSPAIPTTPHRFFAMPLAAHCHLPSHCTSSSFCCLPWRPPSATCSHRLSCHCLLHMLMSVSFLCLPKAVWVSGFHSQAFLFLLPIDVCLHCSLLPSSPHFNTWLADCSYLSFTLNHISHIFSSLFAASCYCQPPASTLCLFKPLTAP